MALASQNNNVHLVRNTFNCTHARGIRKGIVYVDQLEGRTSKDAQSNVLLVCDTDISRCFRPSGSDFTIKSLVSPLNNLVKSNSCGTLYSAEPDDRVVNAGNITNVPGYSVPIPFIVVTLR